MFTNSNLPADTVQALREIGSQIDPARSQSIIEELFHTWVCSEEPETTNSTYRRDVVQTVTAIRQLLHLTQVQEVRHD